MPTNKFKTVVDGIFTSKLIYCITAWGGVWGLKKQQNHQRRNMAINKEDMRKLQVLQNRTLRLITGMDYNTPTSILLKTTNLMSAHQMVVYHTACQIFKIKQSKLPQYHYDRLFPEVIDDQQTDTRCNNIARIDFNLSLARSSFFYQGSQIWKALPNNITSAPKLKTFKKLCNAWVLKNVPIKMQ